MKYLLIFLFIFLSLFAFRIYSIGGIHNYPSFQPSDNSVLLLNLRTTLQNKVIDHLPSPQAELLSGMLLGVKSALPPDFKLALTNTSTIHVVVVSGQNLTLVAGFFISLAPLIGRKKAIIISLFAIVFYLLLTGFQAPSIRAAIMVGLASLAQLFGKNRESPWILFLTGGAMLLWNPNWLVSISFQLSFLATFGVIVVAPLLIKYLNFLPEIIKQDLSISIATQALTWPIIALNFHQISLVGVITNTLVLWTVPFIMISGAAAISATFLNSFIAQLLFIAPNSFLTYFVYVINFFNQWGSVKINNFPSLILIGYYLLFAGLFWMLKQKSQEPPLDIARLSSSQP